MQCAVRMTVMTLISIECICWLGGQYSVSKTRYYTVLGGQYSVFTKLHWALEGSVFSVQDITLHSIGVSVLRIVHSIGVLSFIIQNPAQDADLRV